MNRRDGGEGESVKSNFEKILVTAALPYANGKIHLGHLAGAYLPADIYVRYVRSRYGKEKVLFICGSDEHGVAITITAEQEKTTPQAVVDRYHELNKAAFEKFGMSFDNYSRTSLPLHHETARDFFLKLHSAGILKEKKEKQLYDEKANMFLPDRYVEGTCPICQNPEARGDQCEQCGTFLEPLQLINPKSKITGETPTVKETTHLYFPLGDFQQRLQTYIDEANKRDGWKDNVLRYCESWFKDGLTDRAVTRDLSWGVKIPLTGYERKVMYVWFDAVLGYISSTKEWSLKTAQPEKWKEYWQNKTTKYVAFIGKDNVVFHCIVFPAMLMAWNDNSPEKFVLPENVPANEFLNFEGQKFSKSRGWGIDVDDFLAEFSADSLRYALTMNLPENRDTDFYWKDFQARHNNELADILGNFVNRTLTFVHQNFGGSVPAPVQYDSLDKEFIELMVRTRQKSGELIEHYKFKDAALEVMNLARFANRYFDSSKPWQTKKEDNSKCQTTIYLCVEAIRSLAILMEPILPFTAERMWNLLGLTGKPHEAGWDSVGDVEAEAVKGQKINRPEILFTKIEDEIIQKKVQMLQFNSQSSVSQTSHVKSTINIGDFKKIDLRVAKVLTAENVPKSDKLLKLRVSLGNEERQIIAGIAQQYKPEVLIGRKIIVVANLAPAKLMGLESQGMLLAATDNDGTLKILTIEGDLKEGSVVQ
jgi:methionyl-tRNA synthetase